MKNLIYLLVILLLASCSKNHEIPKQVIIAGKIFNFDPENKNLKLSVNRLGFGQQQIHTDIDSLGNFSASFESYIPTDIWVIYKTNFLVLAHPGDSINVKFDGNSNRRPELLKSIKFGGDAVKANQDAAKFQQLYFSNPLHHDWDAKDKAVKDYDLDQFGLYLDTLQQRIRDIHNTFVEEVSPNEEVKIWAKTYIEQNYYDALAFYPRRHKRANKLTSKEWIVPTSYYNDLKKRLPITESMLVSGSALSSFINRYHYDYVSINLRAEEDKQKNKTDKGYTVTPPNVRDSLQVYGIIKHTRKSVV